MSILVHLRGCWSKLVHVVVEWPFFSFEFLNRITYFRSGDEDSSLHDLCKMTLTLSVVILLRVLKICTQLNVQSR